MKVPRDLTIGEFHAQYPSPVPPEVVAIASGVAGGEKLRAGSTDERIVGGELPER